MNRLLIERIEGRILLGVVMFAAIMVLVGWVAINEPSRMAAFEQLNLGRSIERGAEKYASLCSSCHGVEGYGQAGRAPALNNPHLFGYDYLASINGEIAILQRTQVDLEQQIAELQTERDELFTEAGSDPGAERLTEITTRIPEIDTEIADLEARVAELDEEITPLLEERLTQIDAIQPAIDAGYLPGFAAAQEAGGLTFTNFLSGQSSRLTQVGWGGEINGYIVTTLIHGRPGSGGLWNGNMMAAWSQQAGGPLRQDEIQDIANYIQNWDKGTEWTSEDLFAVQQFGKLQADAELVSAGGGDIETIGTDVDAIVASLEGVEGDPTRGESLYTGQGRTELNARLGCSACHAGGALAPATEENWTTAENVRINDSANSGHTAQSYLIESIVLPNEYIAPGYSSGAMPETFGSQMSAQDMADVLAYLESYAN